MFKDERNETTFEWGMIGDIKEGRPNLGSTVNVAVYRLMQFTLRDTMIRTYGVQETDRLLYRSGELAGEQFFRHLVEETADFQKFIDSLQHLFRDLGIGILRMEKADLEKLEFTIVVEEDLDCSGLPVCGEQVCTYDEGFLAGLLSAFTARSFHVKEVDCWCSGERVCRFVARAR
ncbi:MAG: 4-vinyl reductase [Spirochaetes bacterium]|nr:4-vinyl reductase [Spirochaetota bacterium]